MVKKLLLTCLLAATLAGCATSNAIKPPPGQSDITSPDFFPILPWDPLHGWNIQSVQARTNGLEDIAACHFNMAGFVLPRDLPLCRKLGLGAIVFSTDRAFTNVQYIYSWKKLSAEQIDQRVKEMVAAAGSDPTVKGFFITDEPGEADFHALGQAVAAVKKYAPGKLAYINLFPNYATAGAPDLSQLGASSYDEYLEKFVQEVHPQMISYDNYQVLYSTDLDNADVAASYYQNLLAVRRVALEHHLPCLNIVASAQLQPAFPPPSPANLLFQTYTTLAAGYRGVTWYTYFGDFYPYAPFTKSGEKTPAWGWLQQVNGQVAALAPVMSHLVSTGIFFSKPPAPSLPSLPGDLIESVSSPCPVMVGEFKHENGRRYAMLVNLSLKQTVHLTLKTKSTGVSVSQVSAMDGSLSPFDPKTGLWLTAGQGILLEMEGE